MKTVGSSFTSKRNTVDHMWYITEESIYLLLNCSQTLNVSTSTNQQNRLKTHLSYQEEIFMTSTIDDIS